MSCGVRYNVAMCLCRAAGTQWRGRSRRRAWRGRRARAASRRAARCRLRLTATVGATQVPHRRPKTLPTNHNHGRRHCQLCRRSKLFSDWSVDVAMTAGLDPARNTVVETRTFFRRVRSSPLYCHLLFHFLALFHFGFVSCIFR